MNKEIKTITHDSANFWYEARQYFESVTLLAEAIANQLVKEGYDPIDQQYGFKFLVYDHGHTRLVYDRLKNHWLGRFTIGDSKEKQENVVYGFGITFGFNDPQSNVDPWIPLVYFFKSKMVDNKKWNDWDYSRILFSPSNLLMQLNEEETFIIKIPVSNFDAIEYVNALIFPLGAIRTTDDVSKIVKPSIEALHCNNESPLQEIKTYLLSVKEEWKVESN